jgi:photosystem II stability/assembly factor-like uncharacterized protein
MRNGRATASIRLGLPMAILLSVALIPAVSSGNSSIWRRVGPYAGPVTCVAVGPSAPATVYAGTPAGCFRSIDGGVTWTGVNAGLTYLRISVLAVDPKDSRTVYVVPESMGVFRSTDGGESWTPSSNGLSNGSVTALVFDPLDPATLYAGTMGGIFKTTDAGGSWTAANAGLPGSDLRVTALAVDSRRPATVYAAVNNEGIFKSTDGGVLWLAVNTGLPNFFINALVIDPRDGETVYAGLSNAPDSPVWKTVSGGSWSPAGGTGLTKSWVTGLAIDPINPDTIYASGGGIFKSSDCGDTWTALAGIPVTDQPLVIDPENPAILYAVTGSGIFRSTDGGTTWMQSNTGLSSISVGTLVVDPLNRRTVYAGSDSGLFKSTNGGNTWVLKRSGPITDLVIDPADPETLYECDGGVDKSSDGGETWQDLPISRSGIVTVLAVDPHNPKTVWFGSYDITGGPYLPMGVYRSSDGGETWSPANNGLPVARNHVQFLAVDPSDSNTIYVSGTSYPYVAVPPLDMPLNYRSTDGGASWQLVSNGITPIAADPKNGGTLYGIRDVGLLRSTDGGASWLPFADQLKGKTVGTLVIDPSSSIMIAGSSDGEIFGSTDAGASWTQINTGVLMGPVASLALEPQSLEVVYAGTTGGVFKLESLGSEWAVDVPAGGAAVMSTAESGAGVLAGYATAAVDFGPAPSGVAVFSFRQNGVVVSEAGVPASPPTRAARIFVEYRSGAGVPGQPEAGPVDVDTGLALANPGCSDANVTYTLRDSAGLVVATGHGSLAAGAHFADFIRQLGTEAPDFELPEDFQTAVQFGSLDIDSDQPLSVLALRLTTNQRREALLTTTPTADLTEPLRSTPLYFPHFVDGGGYSTKLILINTSRAPESGLISFFDDRGEPLAVNQVGPFGSSFAPYYVQAGGVFVFQADGLPASVHEGSVQLAPTAGTSTPLAAGVFGFSRNGILVSESGIPAAEPTAHARIYVDQSDGYGTGIAIAAPGTSPTGVELKTYQTDGTTSAGNSAAPIALSRNGHIAGFVSELIPDLPAGFTGILDISSPTPFVALTMRSLVNARGDFLLTTFPVADMNHAAPSPIVFPQIADGGGYRTQFILLGGGGTSGVTLQLWDDDGTPLPVGKN